MASVRILCIAVLLSMTMLSPSHAGSRVALVIGNGAYAQASQLLNPVRDARAISDKLKTLGFDVTYTIDRTKVEMERILQSFVHVARGADVALLFYAGHGIQVRGKNYFIPVDAKLSDVNDVEFELLEVTKMVATIERSAKVTLLFLDACRDNPFIDAMRGYTRAVGSRGLAQISNPSLGTLISYAAQPGTVAQDGVGRHSPYTAALLEHLGTPGQSISQTLTRVRRAVYDATKGGQVPQDFNSLLDEFYITPKAQAEEDTGKLNDELAALEAELKRLQEGGEVETDVAATDPGAEIAVTEPSLKSGEVFNDCGSCPEMVVVPGGTFLIGSPKGEQLRERHEGPQKKISIARNFAIGKYEISFGQFKEFVKDAEYDMDSSCWRDPGFLQTDHHPAVCVRRKDALAYTAWLSERTGKAYRLPTEAEWEYAARAGSKGMYSTGRRISIQVANYVGWFDRKFSGAKPVGDGYGRTIKVQTLKPNKFGLHHVHGNVSEWVQDCYTKNYDALPGDGNVHPKSDCHEWVLRGGSWNDKPWSLRSASRAYGTRYHNGNYIGFRVARDLP